MRRARAIEGGDTRNEREAETRLEELEAKHLKWKKHATAVRRHSATFVTTNKGLEALTIIPELCDQCYIRSMAKHNKKWQRLGQDVLVKLCLKCKRRTAFMPGEGESDDVTETENARSDKIELDDSSSDSVSVTSADVLSPVKKKRRGS